MQLPDKATRDRMTGQEQWDWFMQDAIEHHAERARQHRRARCWGWICATIPWRWNQPAADTWC